VRRDSEVRRIPAARLVPGDILLLEAGQVVPADLRLVEASELKLDEAALTGESEAVTKQTEVLSGDASALGERRNMAFKGTLVTSGRGSGVVVATGMQTELGRIASMLHEKDVTRTPLQRRLAGFGQRLGVAVLAVCAVIFVFGLLRGEPLTLMFLTAVSLAVAAIPEALPAVVTVSLAIGARKMSARNALIRRLPAVETLGSVTYICADKTGTLTENRMQVGTLLVGGERQAELPRADTATPAWQRLGQAMGLSNDARLLADEAIAGDPTETALYVAARAAGFDKTTLEKQLPRVAELPFDAQRRCMTTLHRDGEGITAFIKGAPETILGLCTDALTADGNAALDKPARRAEAEALGAEGYRVLGLATRRLDELPDRLRAEEVERDFTFLGFVALIDPPRAETARSVALCRSAGITPVMITGDHAATAKAIAVRLGIAQDDDPSSPGRNCTTCRRGNCRNRWPR
ncbi:MAG: HAD-IC family P-type ATPase, partial [Thiogranum sp.]